MSANTKEEEEEEEEDEQQLLNLSLDERIALAHKPGAVRQQSELELELDDLRMLEATLNRAKELLPGTISTETWQALDATYVRVLK